MKSQIKTTFSNFFFEYETPRQVLVKNKRVAVVCRIIQMGVLAYIIGWVFMYEKGYQVVDTAIGSIFTKMKGVSFTNISKKERIWDVADYVFPEQGDSSFVVMTNYIVTVGQKQGKCAELPDGKNKCNSDADCDEGKYKRMGNGHMTGRCMNESSTCEIYSWCPVEDDWDCNLDLSIRHCKPKYEFYGLYGTGKNGDKEEKPSLGYNFRYAKYYVEDAVEKRTLMKVFGVRIDIIVHGRAGKFDIIPTLTAIGSGVGIFGVATVVCDMLLLYLVPKRDFYKNMKFKHTQILEEKPDLPQSKTERDLPKE